MQESSYHCHCENKIAILPNPNKLLIGFKSKAIFVKNNTIIFGISTDNVFFVKIHNLCAVRSYLDLFSSGKVHSAMFNRDEQTKS